MFENMFSVCTVIFCVLIHMTCDLTCSNNSFVLNIPIPGVYLTLNGDYIPNHGYVMISDIGSTDGTALICNTNRFGNRTTTPTSTYFHSGGDWFAPDGTTVGNRGKSNVPGFERNRAPMMVILLRRTASDPPPEGIYYCVVEDDTFTEQTVYVGLYNSEGRG